MAEFGKRKDNRFYKKDSKGVSSNSIESGSSHSNNGNSSQAKMIIDNKKFTLSDYIKNEDRNYHSENAVALVERFGTPEEIKEIKEIAKRHEKLGYIPHNDYERRYKLSSKYYDKLVDESEKPYPDEFKEYENLPMDFSSHKFFDNIKRRDEFVKDTNGQIYTLVDGDDGNRYWSKGKRSINSLNKWLVVKEEGYKVDNS